MSNYTFISYAHENTKFAISMARILQNQGISVWLDQWNHPQEQAWDQLLAGAVKECTHFVLLLSPAAVNSWVVREQTLLALRAGKHIVPVICQPCQLPAALEGILCINISGKGASFQAAMNQLVLQLADEPANLKSGQRHAFSWEVQAEARYSFYFILMALAVALIFFWGVTVFWPRSLAEAVIVPAQVEPVTMSEPVFVPTTEILPAPNLYPTPIQTNARSTDGQIVVFVPGGDFLMGSSNDDLEAGEDEKPQRVVYVDPFWIDKTEIINDQYQRCIDAGVCTPSRRLTTIFFEPHLPVVGVNWEQASAYCQWVGARLPTEAEWEKAARGTAGRIYPWGNDFDGHRLNYCDAQCVADWRDLAVNDGYRYTAPPGSFLQGASPYGVLDMSGNVWEWTSDWYAPDAYSTALYKNPTGPKTGLQRVIRGGSWYYPRKSLRAARRHRDVPTSGYDNIGFRCVVSSDGF